MLDSHPTKYIQVFKHWGRTSGHAAVADGEVPEAVVVTPWTELDGAVTVMTVEETRVEEERTVEVVEVVSRLVTPPVVWVKVTGQMVVDSLTITVVIAVV